MSCLLSVLLMGVLSAGCRCSGVSVQCVGVSVVAARGMAIS